MDMAFSDSLAFDTQGALAAPRPLGWSELCARLVAAQDLRRHQAAAIVRVTAGVGDAAPAGSFHARAADMLAHHASPQDFVNSTYSVYGKDNQGTSSGSRENLLITHDQHQDDENCHD
jgi:hypothetical protein